MRTILIFIFALIVVTAFIVFTKPGREVTIPLKTPSVSTRECTEGSRKLIGDRVEECIDGKWEYVGISSESKG